MINDDRKSKKISQKYEGKICVGYKLKISPYFLAWLRVFLHHQRAQILKRQRKIKLCGILLIFIKIDFSRADLDQKIRRLVRHIIIEKI